MATSTLFPAFVSLTPCQSVTENRCDWRRARESIGIKLLEWLRLSEANLARLEFFGGFKEDDTRWAPRNPYDYIPMAIEDTMNTIQYVKS